MLARARFFFVKFFLLLHLMESSIRVQEQSATGGDRQVRDCLLNHISVYTCTIDYY